MAAIRDIHNEWRDSLVPASYRGAVFHVETSSRSSGRRTVIHQYPKRNIPYSEDLGREAIKWKITGYLIHGDRGIPGNLLTQIDDLIFALEADDAGILIHPLLGAMLVMVENYSYSDSRTRGGYVEFEMSFVEAGSPVMSQSFSDAGSSLQSASSDAEQAGVSGIQTGSSGLTADGKQAGIV